jgi:SseB protein N-terminal domain
VSRHLEPGGQQFRGDHGAADPQVAAALAAYLAGRGSERAALGALAAARLLVPVIAVLADSADQASAQDDKSSEMMLPKLIGRDGRPAMLAFTGTAALARWRPNARPVPAGADRVWRAAVADGCAVVIDVAGPVPLVVEGARLAALAAGQPVPPPHEDPDVRAEVEAAVAGEPRIAAFSLSPGHEAGPDPAGPGHEAGPDPAGPGHAAGPDLAVKLQLARPVPAALDWEPAVKRAAASIAARLAGRLRRGIEVNVAE